MNTTYNDSLIKTNSFTYSSSFPHLLTFNNSNSFVYDGLYLKQIKNYMGQVIKQFNYRGTKISSIQEPLQNKTIIFDYDYQGRRTKKLNQTTNDLIEYYYDENLLIKEKHSNYSLNFLYNESNELIGFEHISSNNSTKTKYFYLRNAFNDIVEVLDENGNSLVHYLYDAFGNIIETIDNSSISLGAINPFRYRGYYYDVETQLYWVSSRYYAPELCRWISPDSIEYLNTEYINGLNLYIYCSNNPIMYADPSGHSIISIIVIAALIGSAVSAGISIGGELIRGNFNPLNWNWKNILGSALVGFALGASMTAGGLAGIGAISGWATFGLFVGTTALSFGAGAAEYALKYAGTEEFSWTELFIDAGLTAIQSMIGFGLGAAMSSSGMWKSLNKGEFSKSYSAFKSQGNNFVNSLFKSTGTFIKNNGTQIVARNFVKNVFTIPYKILKYFI